MTMLVTVVVIIVFISKIICCYNWMYCQFFSNFSNYSCILMIVLLYIKIFRNLQEITLCEILTFVERYMLILGTCT